MNIKRVSIPFVGYSLPFIGYILINEYIECGYTVNFGYIDNKFRSNDKDIEK